MNLSMFLSGLSSDEMQTNGLSSNKCKQFTSKKNGWQDPVTF